MQDLDGQDSEMLKATPDAEEYKFSHLLVAQWICRMFGTPKDN